MVIGIIVATEPERRPFLKAFGIEDAFQEPDIFDVIRWDPQPRQCIYLIMSGYGEIAAAAATQHLIDRYKVDLVINYGVAGGLSKEEFVGKVGYVSSIVHYGFDLSDGGKYQVGRYPNQDGVFLSPARDAFANLDRLGLTEFVCASADRFVGGGVPKRKLHEKFGANICEMEAAAIVIICNANKIPCTFIKAVSDSVEEGAEAFNRNVYRSSELCVNAIKKLL